MCKRSWLSAAVVLAVTAGVATLPGVARSEEPMGAASEAVLLAPDALRWGDGPPGLPAGAKIAVLQGDPSKPGPFTVRLRFGKDFKIAPHTHPSDEQVTVLEGSLSVGEGATFDEKSATLLPVGGFAMLPKGMPHFAFSRDGATIQLHGTGPFEIKYENPSDDPRTGTPK
jgi:hypothetical protein